MYIFRDLLKRVAKQKIYEKKVKISNVLAIEVNFTFMQEQSPKNTKKKIQDGDQIVQDGESRAFSIVIFFCCSWA